ncbi:MAG: hypothetical protein LBR08_08695 [Bacteroidales bacterium]|nr:hypothetical protein [Bacteroidales bacterium]
MLYAIIFRYDKNEKYRKEIDFLKERQKIAVFPYKKTKQINNTVSGYDSIKQLPYVIHKNRRLYFANTYSEAQSLEAYKNFIEVENILGGNYAEKAPHQYQTERFHVMGNDILLDIGCAEALFTLDVIDKVKKAILFEFDPIWYEPLRATFEKEIASGKVILIEKYVGSQCNEYSVTVDSVLKNENCESLFIKMDIEGNEPEVVKSCENLMKTDKNIRFSCCTYHRENDARILQSFFESNGYHTEFSDGYMLFFLDKHIRYPYFRHGIIRASKHAENTANMLLPERQD